MAFLVLLIAFYCDKLINLSLDTVCKIIGAITVLTIILFISNTIYIIIDLLNL